MLCRTNRVAYGVLALVLMSGTAWSQESEARDGSAVRRVVTPSSDSFVNVHHLALARFAVGS